MSRTEKISACILIFLFVVCLCIGFSACGGKDAESSCGYGEEGTYYFSESEGEDSLLTLRGGEYMLSLFGEPFSGVYSYNPDMNELMLFTREGEDERTDIGFVTEEGISLTYEGRTYFFMRREYYIVSFTDGGTIIMTQSVLNGKAASDPGDVEKDGHVFLGWYTDPDFNMRYEFDAPIFSDTTVYARFVERDLSAKEHSVTYDYTGETVKTINGVLYDLPEPERSGCVFLGWWVSVTNSADELTYKYDGDTIREDTTLFAVFVPEGEDYMGASVRDDRLTWENYSASVTDVILYNEDWEEIERFYVQSTRGEYSFDFAALPAGKYRVTVRGGGVNETLTYVSHALGRVSGFTVISGSILMYDAVENAERYYITIECGTEGHGHEMIDNGSSLYYDFSHCEMPAEGIAFTVYAYADGYVMSESTTFSYFLGLERTEVTVEGSLISWTPVSMAMQYEIYINGALVATTPDTTYSIANYGTGTYEIAVRPVTTGYYSEKSDAYSFTKTTLASPSVTGIEDYTITWTEVEGATGYKVSINGVETTIEGGSVTSLILSDDNYTEGLDSYEISVKALAQDSNNDSPYGETITVTGNSVGSAVSYANNTVTWQYSLSASEYRITVNDGDETIVTGTNSANITLTKSGNNEITVYFVNDEDDIYGTASVTVYAYAIVFDARGGTAYDAEENEIDVIYVAKGDTVILPDAYYEAVITDFVGWYTLPDTTDDPDADRYMGDGVLIGDGSFVFTGNSTLVLYACWLSPRFLVSLDPGAGTILDDEGNVVTETTIAYNSEKYSVALPVLSDAAYAFVGWYSGPDGTGTRYTDESGNAVMAFSDESVTTLYAFWAEVLDFSVGAYNAQTVLSVSKGPDIDLVSEVTIPETYSVNGKNYTSGYMGGMAFSDCPNLKVINIPDTMMYIQVTSNGYASGAGVFAGTDIESVNVYTTGDEPSTTKEVTFYSKDGVLFQKNASGGAELYYYPHGRTDDTYTVPESVANENEHKYSGDTLNTVPVTRSVTSIAGSVFRENTALVTVEIPDSVTQIGAYAFYQASSLESVEMEARISTLEDYTFYQCTALKAIEIPDSVTEIGNSCFYGCSLVRTVKFPANLTAIDGSAFYNCSVLLSAELPYGLKTIASYAFYNCPALRAVVLPYGVTEIGSYAFYGCSSLSSAEIPEGTTSIGGYAFASCTQLKTVYIPSTLKSISNYTFQSCSSLRELTLSEGLESIGNYAFSGCYSLVSLTVPSSLEYIGTNAFQNCYKLLEIYNLSSIEISAGSVDADNGYIGEHAINVYTPDEGVSHLSYSSGYTFIYDDDGNYYLMDYRGGDTDLVLPDSIDGHAYDIYDYAFYYGISFMTVVIPDCVRTIGERAFRYCTSLVKITLGSGLEAIGSNAFQNCYKLVEVCNNSFLTVTAGGSGNGGVAAYAKYVYMGSGEDHLFYAGDFRFVRDEDDDYFLVGYYGDETDIALPDDVYGESYAILDYAFYGDSSLKSVIIPNSVTAIGAYAFYECTSLEKINIGLGVTKIGVEAFYRCRNLKTLTIPSGVTEIGSETFYYCSSLESIDLGGNVTSIGTYAFYQCISLSDINLCSGMTSIGTHAFQYCYSLTEIEIPDGVREIGDYAFYSCSGLTEIKLPDSVTKIGKYAFDVCTSMVSVDLGEGLKEIGDSAFNTCSALIGIVIPDTVTTIGSYAFAYCRDMQYVVIGAGVEEIGDYAFNNCSSLAEVYYRGDQSSWSQISVGSGNSSLTGATIYFYTETAPASNGNFWRWSDGNIDVW